MAIRAWLTQYKASKEGSRELRGKRRKIEKKTAETSIQPAKINDPNAVGFVNTRSAEFQDTNFMKSIDQEGRDDVDSKNEELKSIQSQYNIREKKEENPNPPEGSLASLPCSSPSSSHNSSLNSKTTQSADVPFVRILEALSATGLRAIRYAREVPQVSRVVANDLLGEAVASINRSAQYNELQEKVVGHQGNAIKYMGSLSDSEKFHVVDLDPYGTAAPFLDSAVQLVRDNGFLMVTCTDAGVLAGVGYPEKCFALYGGNNFGNTVMGLELNHEAGLRLILGTIASAAARYKKAIEPVLSLSIDYYFRVFVRITTSPLKVKLLAANTMLTYHCVGCGHKIDQRFGRYTGKNHQTPRISAIPGENCMYCDRVYHLAGPMWAGPLHCPEFIDSVLAINRDASPESFGTRERIKGTLTLAKNELNVPFYFNLNQLSSLLKCPPLAIDDFAKAIGNMGFHVSLTHAKRNCVKTDAPWENVLQIGIEFLRYSNERALKATQAQLESETDDTKKQRLQQKVDKLSTDLSGNANLKEGMVGYTILLNVAKNPNVNFQKRNEESDKLTNLRKVKMVRFQETPKNWGPQSRPKE